jgi:hypothetical protein
MIDTAHERSVVVISKVLSQVRCAAAAMTR